MRIRNSPLFRAVAMNQNAQLILWIYIALLVVGGMIGFFKAKSKISLIMSLAFAAVLSLCATRVIPSEYSPKLEDGLMALLLVVFGMRLAKTKKFMPSGLMLLITVAALILRHVRF